MPKKAPANIEQQDVELRDWRTNIKEANLLDLRLLAMYSRSRPTGGKASIEAVIKGLKEAGLTGSKDAAIASIARLEREYDIVALERRPTVGPRGRDVPIKRTIREHFGHPEDHEGFTAPTHGSRRKARLTLDGEILAEVASLVGLYETIVRDATGRTSKPKPLTFKTGPRKGQQRPIDEKGRPEVGGRRAVLGWLRTERRRMQDIVQRARSADGSVFQLRSTAEDEGLGHHPLDTWLVDRDKLPKGWPIDQEKRKRKPKAAQKPEPKPQ